MDGIGPSGQSGLLQEGPSGPADTPLLRARKTYKPIRRPFGPVARGSRSRLGKSHRSLSVTARFRRADGQDCPGPSAQRHRVSFTAIPVPEEATGTGSSDHPGPARCSR
jgi:hypothetical protein